MPSLLNGQVCENVDLCLMYVQSGSERWVIRTRVNLSRVYIGLQHRNSPFDHHLGAQLVKRMHGRMSPILGCNKAVEDSRLGPRAQRIVRLHSQTPLCTTRLTAEGCKSAGGNADRTGAEVPKLCAGGEVKSRKHATVLYRF